MYNYNYKDHLISSGSSVKEALGKLNQLAIDAILFVVDKENRLIGSLTDGDVRRGLLKDMYTEQAVDDFIQPNPRYVEKCNYSIHQIIQYREGGLKIIPVVDKTKKVVNVINLRLQKSYLPVDAVIMAGGRGSRLQPLTDTVPKPLLKVGDKPIIDYNLNRLRKFGIDDYWLSLRYLGDQVENHFKDGSQLGVNIKYVWEQEALGTIGAVSQIDRFNHDYILITNSDILTTLNYEDFFLDFLDKDADISVLTIPYEVKIPYAVMETHNHHVVSFREKPTYTYYSNGGIYLMKKEVLKYIPKNTTYDATDLMERVLNEGGRLISYPIRQYWLDIGKPEDFERAQEDIKHLEL